MAIMDDWSVDWILGRDEQRPVNWANPQNHTLARDSGK